MVASDALGGSPCWRAADAVVAQTHRHGDLAYARGAREFRMNRARAAERCCRNTAREAPRGGSVCGTHAGICLDTGGAALSASASRAR